jgi:hypothetical protein
MKFTSRKTLESRRVCRRVKETDEFVFRHRICQKHFLVQYSFYIYPELGTSFSLLKPVKALFTLLLLGGPNLLGQFRGSMARVVCKLQLSTANLHMISSSHSCQRSNVPHSVSPLHGAVEKRGTFAGAENGLIRLLRAGRSWRNTRGGVVKCAAEVQSVPAASNAEVSRSFLSSNMLVRYSESLP